jgi:hypothetical protein
MSYGRDCLPRSSPPPGACQCLVSPVGLSAGSDVGCFGPCVAAGITFYRYFLFNDSWRWVRHTDGQTVTLCYGPWSLAQCTCLISRLPWVISVELRHYITKSPIPFIRFTIRCGCAPLHFASSGLCTCGRRGSWWSSHASSSSSSSSSTRSASAAFACRTESLGVRKQRLSITCHRRRQVC